MFVVLNILSVMTLSTYYQDQAQQQAAFEAAMVLEVQLIAEYQQEQKDEARYWARVDKAEYLETL